MRTKFEDLTRDQILNLTDEDIRYYTDYRLAEEGIVLPPMPTDPPEEKEFPEPTIEVYECRGIMVTDIKEAQKIATLESVVSTSYIGDYNYKYVDEPSSYGTGIERKKYYEKEELKKFQAELKQYNKEKSAYNEDLSAYNKAVKESENVTSFIRDMCYNIASEDRFIQKAKDRYEELLVLAQENEEIAYNFFVKAFPVESTEQKLADFYSEESTHGVQVLNYKEFASRCGIKIEIN